MAIRPKTLVAGWAPVLVGGVFSGCWLAAVAEQRDSPDVAGFVLRWLSALVVAVAIQIATNLVNDAADHRRGADTDERMGPPRAVSTGVLAADAVQRAAVAALVVAGLVGLGLVATTSWWLLLPGALSIVAAVAYTAGPKPLAYLGLGEGAVFLFFGLFAVGGTVAVTLVPAFELEPGIEGLFPMFVLQSLWLATPLGLLSVAILEVNNIRDAPTDRLVGKATLAVRIGDRWARRLFATCVVFALVTLGIGFILLANIVHPVPVVICAILLVFPVVLAIASIMAVVGGAAGRALNPVLGRVARLEAFVAMTMCLWMVLLAANVNPQ